MIFLTNSINTINLINAPGVPLGTRCASAKVGCFAQDRITWPIQSGKAKAKVKTKCLDAVKIYGNNPKTLLTKINVNNESKNHVVPGFIVVLKILENSRCKIRNKIFHIYFLREETKNKEAAGTKIRIREKIKH